MSFCHECGGILDDYKKGRFYCALCNITWNLTQGLDVDTWTRRTKAGIIKIEVLRGHAGGPFHLPPNGGTLPATITTEVV